MSEDRLPRLWTEELGRELVRLINQDAKMQKLGAKLNERIQLRCLDTPDGTDVAASYQFKNGQAELVVWDEQPSPAPFRNDKFSKREFLARTTAPFRIWKALDKGEMGVIAAIISPDYKFEGAKMKVLANLRLFQRVSDLSSSINKRYD